MASKKRVSTNKNIDVGSIDNMAFSEKSGAQKNMEVGRHLLPLNATATTFTTDASTAKALPSKGKSIAVYNNASSVAAVTLGDDSSVPALAAGATDGSGRVGIPCAPNDWTYIACWDKQWVRTSAATLMVFIIADDTEVK